MCRGTVFICPRAFSASLGRSHQSVDGGAETPEFAEVAGQVSSVEVFRGEPVLFKTRIDAHPQLRIPLRVILYCAERYTLAELRPPAGPSASWRQRSARRTAVDPPQAV